MFFFSRKKFPSAETLENEEKQKIKLYQEFIETQNSDVLKEYFQLHDEINAPTFKVEKEKITKLSYKKSEDFAKEREFKKLQKNKSIRHYFETLESPALKDFMAFKETEEYKDIYNADKRKQSTKLANFFKFENSKAYRNYKELNSSPILKRYTELKEYLSSEEHTTFKAYCNDSKRWEKTELYQKEKRFNELSKQANITNYLKYKESDYFDEQKNWELSFVDEFNTGQIEDDKWLSSYYWAKQMGNDLYSSEDELQGYQHAKNLSVANKNLTIKTKRENGTGKYWNEKQGFVVKKTPFTSAIISSKNGFDQKEGMLKLKIKLSGNTFVNHSAWLGTSNNDQSLLIFKTISKKFLVGTLKKNSTTVNKAVQLIKNISLYNNYHIVKLEWDENTIKWKVNDSEIKTAKNDLRNAPMHLIIHSTVTNEKKAGEGEMNIDWIRSYSKKIG